MLVVALIACALIQAWLVGAEVALASCNRGRVRQRAAAGSFRARIAEHVAARPQVSTSTTLVGTNAAALIAVGLAALFLAQQDYPPILAVVIAVPPGLVLGHVVPKIVAQLFADRLVGTLSVGLWLLSWPLRPVVMVVSGVATVMTRIVGADRKKTFVTRDELAMLIESEPETDRPQISADEREMIANVFELSEYTVRDLMVPLSGVTALPEDTTLIEAALEVADKQHSRMPVYGTRLDDVVGVVHVFDLMQAGLEGKKKTVGEVARPPTYVPETMKATDLLVELQGEGQHLAIVVDEYGGAVGIVTIEDLLETIVGDIDDEYDREPSLIKVEKPGVWRAEARTPVVRVNQELDLGLPESDDYETVAGLLIERHGRIPDPGESTQVGNVVIEVISGNSRAVEAVRITKKRK
jgi:CBS domain containing-hemolysin-like protein